MSLIHLARQGFITKSALPNVTRQRGTTTGTANLMLYGAGKDFAIGTNTTFTDSSSNNFTVTRNGDTIQATNNPFTGSVYFDGNGDYLSNSTNNSSIAFGSGNFTLEFYIYNTSTATQVIYDTRINVGGSVYDDGGFQIYRDSTTIYVYDTTGAGTLLASTSISTNVWTHFAVVRSGSAAGNVKLYKDGVLASSSASANTTNYTKGYLNIGTWLPAGVPSNFFVGYLSNFRIVKGTAVYTANFTPPTSPLTAITNTQLLLLTAQQAPFRDSSSNNFTVTANGNAAGSGLEPFPVNYAGSGYFDGTTDYLTIPTGAFSFTSGTAFTVEFWMYVSSFNVANPRIIQPSGVNAQGFSVDISNTGVLNYGQSNVASFIASAASTIALNTWYHVAIGKNSSNQSRMWVNGVSVGTGTDTANYATGSQFIGAGSFPSAGSNAFNGYITNLRCVNGTDVYGYSNTTITVPTAPLTAVTNTQLLLLTNNVGPFVDTSANGFPVLRNGDTVQTGFSPFTGQPSAGSAYFDGTGDYLISGTASTQFDFGTGDFTIETWVYPIATGTAASETYLPICGADGSFSTNTSNWSFLYAVTGGNRLVYSTYENGVGYSVSSNTYTPTFNVWQHWACVRSGGVVTFYVNGVSIGGGSFTRNQSYNNKLVVGVMYGGLPAKSVIWYSTMYLSNLRILKGAAQYTSNFTPATAPLPAVPNTSILLNTDNYTIANSTPTYRAITLSGNTTISTAQYPVGMNRSIAFDGNSDYIQVPNDAAIADFGTGDFTIEFFINITSVDYVNGSGGRGATAISTVVGFSGNGWNVEFSGNASGVPNSINFNSRQGGSQTGVNPSVTMSKTVWYHIAVARSGTVTTIYLDGVSVGSTTLSNQTISSTQPIWIGGQNISSYQHWVNGYISNVRIVKGSALYTANFTPPAAPLPLSVTVPAFVTNNIYGVYQLA